MNILLLAAGVADPRRPLDKVTATPAETRNANSIVLSPFDEAAVEMALQIRDKIPGTSISAILLGGRESETIAQKLAAYRLDNLVRLDIDAAALIDAVLLVRMLSAAINNAFPTTPQLVLIGREFGDYDNGAVPALLASNLHLPSFILAQGFRLEGEGVVLYRELADYREEVRLHQPLVASVTNDRSNRLRHPLMKNIMEAKRAELPVTDVPITPAAITMAAMMPPPARVAGVCRMLDGSVDNQAKAMADYLTTWKLVQ